MNKKLLVFFMFLFALHWATAQVTVSYPSPAGSLTRGTGSSLLTVNLGFPAACTGVSVEIGMPAGIEYVPGTVLKTAGAGGLTITENGGTARRPKFTVSNAALGNDITFTITRIANCGAGSAGKDSVYITGSCGSSSETAAAVNNYNILAPALSMTAPAPIVGAQSGNVYTRTLTLTNGGNGCVDSLVFYIVRPAAIITAPSLKAGAVTIPADHTNGDTTFYVVAGAALPGGDNLLCNGEQILFTESYTLSGCLANGNYTEAYGAGWGRNHSAGGLCQKATATGLVNYTSTLPVVTAQSRIANANTCGNPVQVTSVLKNIGLVPVQNLMPYVGCSDLSQPYFIDTVGLMVKINNGTPYHPSGIVKIYTLNGSNSGTACWAGKPSGVQFSIPGLILQPGDSVVVTYTLLTCYNTPAQACGTNFGGDAGFNLGIQYQDMCGTNYTNGLYYPGNISVSPSALVVAQITLTELPAQVFPGQCFNYRVGVTLNGGVNAAKSYFETTLTLPPGVTFNSAYEVTTGIAPSPGYPQQTGNVVTLRYPSYGVQGTFFINYRLCINAAVGCGSIALPTTAAYYLDSTCTNKIYAMACSSPGINVPCTGPGSCTNGGPQVNFFEAYRTNYGKPDNNRDGVADGSGSVDLAKIELTHFRAGDTLHTYMSTAINANTAVPYNDWAYVYNEWNFGTNGYARWVPTTNATVTIKRAGAVLYTFTGIVPSVITAEKRYKADWSSSLPAGFKYLPGDSVNISCDFRLKTNILYYGTNLQFTETEGAHTRINLTLAESMYASQVANPAPAAQYTCSGAAFNYLVLGTSLSENFATNNTGCSNKALNGSITFETEPWNGNIQFFLYEVRPSFQPDSLIFTVPPGYEYVGIASQSYATTPTAVPISITPVVTGNSTTGIKIVYDLKTAIAGGLLWLERGTYYLNHNIKAVGCSTPTSGVATLRATGYFLYANDGINNEPYSLTYNLPLIWDNTTKPTVAIQDNTGTVQGVAAQQYWDVQLNNTNVSYGAPNVWVALEKGTSGITIDSVVLKPTNTVLATNAYGVSDKWYKVSAAGINPNTNQKLRIYFKYSSCTTDSIKLLMGWDCASFPVNPTVGTCGVVSKFFKVVPQESQVQLAMETQPTVPSISMCTTDSVTMLMNSAQTANVDNPTVTIIPPPGLTILQPIQVEYPVGSGNWQGLTPVNNAGNLVLNVEGHTAIGAQGLAGVTNNPGAAGRQVRIKIKFTSTCSYVSGSRIGFITTGQNPCGSAAAGSGDYISTDPVNITGATAAGTAGMTINAAPPELNCTAPVTVPFSMTPITVATQPGDRVVYTLPAGIEYVGNFTPGANCTGCTIAATAGTGGATVLTISLPAGVAANSALAFTVDIKASKITACGNSVITGQAERQTGALFCGGTACPTSYAAIGSATQTIVVKKPKVDVTQLAITQTPTTISYSGTFVNSGTQTAPAGALVKVYCGTNTSGTVLYTFTTPSPIAAGATAIFTGSFPKNLAICPGGSALFMKVQDTLVNGSEACFCGSPAGAASLTVLPVKLSAFTGTAQECKAVLAWVTESEINFSKFGVEYSADGINFKEVGSVAGKNSTTGSAYKYTYVQPDTKGYYRLKMTDIDGRFDYSKIIPVSINCKVRIIAVAPNPTTGIVNITGLAAGDILQVFDADGKLIVKKPIVATQLQLDLSRYSRGMYTISVIRTDGDVYSNKLIKIN